MHIHILCPFMTVLVVFLQILAQLEECKNIPDFNNYLAFILSQGDSLPVEVIDHICLAKWSACWTQQC